MDLASSDSFERFREWILALPSVKEAPHRFGGTELQVDGLEFMHFHGSSFMDIRLSLKDQEWALKDGGAIPHRFAPQNGWVSYRMKGEAEVEGARKLVQKAYDNAKASVERHKC